jgi:hypothetical protein
LPATTATVLATFVATVLATFVIAAMLLTTLAGTALLVLLAGLAWMPAMLSIMLVVILSTVLAALPGIILILVCHPNVLRAGRIAGSGKRAESDNVPGSRDRVASCGSRRPTVHTDEPRRPKAVLFWHEREKCGRRWVLEKYRN